MPNPLLPRITEALLIPAALVCVVGLTVVYVVFERCNRG